MNTRKETEETISAVCALNGKTVSVLHRRIEVPNRPGDPTFLRVDSWYCDHAESCTGSDCPGKVRGGMMKRWEPAEN